MVSNIISKINKGKRAKQVTVILDNEEYNVIGVNRVLDEVQLVVESNKPKKTKPKKEKDGEDK